MGEVETIDEFWSIFRSKCAEFKEKIESLTQESPQTDFPLIKVEMTRVLQEQLATRHANLLPPYDRKRTQEEIEGLGNLLRGMENKLNPRKKFSFARARAKVAAQRAAHANDSQVTVEEDQERVREQLGRNVSEENADQSQEEDMEDDGSYIIDDINNKAHVFTLKEQEEEPPKLLIKNCDGATISAAVLLGAVRIEYVKDSHIYLGPCCTSVYMESCNGCTIFCCSHQLRIHACHGTNLHVRINGHPIIEDCDAMGFAPYLLNYPRMQEHLKASNLSNAKCWDNVIDFRWHKKTESPNWCRLTENMWRRALAPDGWDYGDAFMFKTSVAATAVPVAQQTQQTTKANNENNNNGDDDDDDDDDEEI